MLTDCINERLGLKVTPKQKKAIERQLELLDSSGAGAAGTADETPTEQVEAGPKLVDIKLSGFDAKSKIKVIKQVRSLLGGLGLKEAKELVESVPTVIQKEIKPEQAADIKKKLEEVGAQVELIEL
jgi:ribosomal protein L7/L12